MQTSGLVLVEQWSTELVLTQEVTLRAQLPTSPADGGEFPARHLVTTVKQPGQGRAAFRSAVRETEFRGEYYGVSSSLAPSDYTDKWMETPKDFQKSLNQERAEKLAQGAIKTATGRDSVWKGGYSGRYKGPAVADYHLRENIGKKKVSETDMLDRIYRESKALFVGTIYEHCFTIYHDQLKIIRCKEGVEHMKKIGMWPYLLKNVKSYT